MSATISKTTPRRARPRIALVVPSFPKLSETFILRHALGLLDRGHDVHILCRRFDAQAWSTSERLRHRAELRRRIHLEPPTASKWRAVAHLPKVTTAWRSRRSRKGARKNRSAPIADLRSLYLESSLARLDPDIVHFEFGSLAPARLPMIKRLGFRAVVSFRGFDLNYVGLEDPGHYAPVWRHADGLHLLGEDLWRRALRRGCPPDMPHLLIPPAVDAEHFAALEETADGSESQESAGRPLRLLSVGRLEWKKGHDYALRALRLLIDRGVDARLDIAGAGEMLGALSFMRHQLGLDDHVEFLGPLPHEEIRQRLAEADILLHLSISEGFGNAVLEAQAMGVPVLASDADGLSENVADGESGVIVPRRDPEAAAIALEKMARQPSWRRGLGYTGRERVKSLFTPAREIDLFEELYRMVLGKKDEASAGAVS